MLHVHEPEHTHSNLASILEAQTVKEKLWPKNGHLCLYSLIYGDDVESELPLKRHNIEDPVESQPTELSLWPLHIKEQPHFKDPLRP